MATRTIQNYLSSGEAAEIYVGGQTEDEKVLLDSIDALDSTNVDQPLSANQGRILNGSKENALGNPATDGEVLVSTIAGVRTWATRAATWGSLTGILSNQVDLQIALNGKSNTGHDHDAAYEPKNPSLTQHIVATTNPHAVTKSQVGLSNVDNTSDGAKPVSVAQQNAIDAKEDSLGNPLIANQVLASSLAGVRTWITVTDTNDAATWGNITGSLVAQTDLIDALNLKFDKTGGDISGDVNIVSGSGAKLNIKSTVAGGQPQLHLTDNNGVPRGIFGADSASGDVGLTRIDGAGGVVGTIRLDTLGNVKLLAGATETIPVMTSDEHLVNKKYVDDYGVTLENNLGTPTVNGMVLASDTLGNRSWFDLGTRGVTSINGATGVVTLTTTEITEGTNLYFTTARADTRVQAAIQDTVSSATTLYSSSKIDSLVAGALTYKGGWDATNNIPAISDAGGASGDFYKVGVAGSQDLGSGPISFNVGDDVIHNGLKFEQFGTANAVDSVNGAIGTVVLDTDDITEGSVNLYHTDARVDARLIGLLDDATIELTKTWSSTKIDAAISDAGAAIIFPVTAVNGKTGNVALVKADIQLGNVDNTSDIDKPISSATSTALSGKSDTNHLHTGVYEPASAAIQTHVSTTDGSNPHDTTFDSLADTPDMAGNATYGVYVNAAENGIEYRKDIGLAAEAKPTGLEIGGELNIVNVGADVEVISGRGVKVDSFTNPADAPIVVELSWNVLSEPIQGIAVAGATTYMLITDGGVPGPIAGTNLGVLQQLTSTPSPSVVRDAIYLGYVLHNGSSWGEVSAPIVVNNSAISLGEYIKTVAGPSFIQAGGSTSESSTFSLTREAGIVWELNRNWHVNKKDPHRESFNEALNFQWKYVNNDLSVVSAATSIVDPSLYDNSGTVEAVPGNNSTTTIQRVYIDPRDNFWVLYGQNTYDTYTEAISQIGVDEANTVIPSLLARGIFLGYIISEKASITWAPSTARFVSATEASGGGASTAPITTFLDLVDTPSSYTADQMLVVNPTGDAVISQTIPDRGIGKYLTTNIIHDPNDVSGGVITTGHNNNLYGTRAGEYVTTGSYNIGIGTNALVSDGVNTLTGNANIAIGWQAGASLTSGSNNVLIGTASGDLLTTESDVLDIRTSTNQLISGNFSAQTVKVHGELLANNVVFPPMKVIAPSTNITVAIKEGQYQEVTLTAAATLSFTVPSGPATFYLHVHQDATGGHVLTLPNGKWINSIVKENTLSANAHDVIMVHYYGGTNYVFEMMQNLG